MASNARVPPKRRKPRHMPELSGYYYDYDVAKSRYFKGAPSITNMTSNSKTVRAPPNRRTPRHMPELPGYYYDAAKNRYFKGSPPRPPKPPLPSPSKRPSLFSLLQSTALGEPISQSRCQAALLCAAKPPTEPITLSYPISPSYGDRSETLAWKAPNSLSVRILTFPNQIQGTCHYTSTFSPLEYASNGVIMACVAPDGVYTYQRRLKQWNQTSFTYNTRLTTVSLSTMHVVAAGDDVILIPIYDPRNGYHRIPLRGVLCCDVVDPVSAFGMRNGEVGIYDHAKKRSHFYPSRRKHSVVSLKIRGDLLWCSTLLGGRNLSAWDMRDLTRPAIICKGQKNEVKKVGMDVTDTLVVAGGDDNRVRIWDIRGGGVLSEIEFNGVVKRVKMAGWRGGERGTCGVWLDTSDEVYAHIIA